MTQPENGSFLDIIHCIPLDKIQDLPNLYCILLSTELCDCSMAKLTKYILL
jgi:hypothetical protein